jgi:hypothetical protein
MCKRRAPNDSARFKHHHLACEAGKDHGVDVSMSQTPHVLGWYFRIRTMSKEQKLIAAM